MARNAPVSFGDMEESGTTMRSSGARRASSLPSRSKTRLAAWGAAASFALIAIGVVAVALGCPPVDALHDHRPPQASLVFDREGKLLARLAPEERIVVPLSSMSPKLTGAPA